MENKKESMLITYLKHPGMWINALLGRPNPVSIPEAQVEHPNSPKPVVDPSLPVAENIPREVSRDSSPLAEDLTKAKNIFHQVTEKIEAVAKPMVQKAEEVGAESSHAALSKINGSVGIQSFAKKLVPLVLFIGVLIILIIGGLFIMRSLNKSEAPAIVTGPTPTAAEFIPSEPSVYAQDQEVLDLERDVNVLQREIAGTSLRETTLNPPVLDFNITF